MSSGFRNTARNPCSRAIVSSGVPGSVIATNCVPFGALSQKNAKWLSVSVVPPDLLATTNRVRSSSSSPATRSIVAGCVVSSTMSSSAPSANPNVRAKTSGARLDPPIPSSTAVSNPSAAACFANASSSPIRSCIRSTTVSQPRRLAISVGSSFQTVWSLRQMRSTTRSWSIRCEAFGDRDEHRRQRGALAAPARRAPRSSLLASVRSSASKSLAKDTMPSSSSVSVTSVRLMPSYERRASRSAFASSSPSSTRSAARLPWSRKASMVAIGIVFTVSRPTSASTYSVSG